MTWAEERRIDLMLNLYHARKLLAEHQGHASDNGRTDLVIRIRRAETEYRELSGTVEEYDEFVAGMEAAAVERARQRREDFYTRTGQVPDGN